MSEKIDWKKDFPDPVCYKCGKGLFVPFDKYLGYLVCRNPDCEQNKSIVVRKQSKEVKL